MHCTNCGKELLADAKFCDGCGAAVSTEQTPPQQAEPQPQPQVQPQPQPQAQYSTGTSTDTKDQDNKIIFMLSYLGILFFLPLVVCPESKVGRFHANQGLLICIASIAGSIVLGIVSFILLAISSYFLFITNLLSWAFRLAIIALVIMGMLNANKGEMKPLPVIGRFTIIK